VKSATRKRDALVVGVLTEPWRGFRCAPTGAVREGVRHVRLREAAARILDVPGLVNEVVEAHHRCTVSDRRYRDAQRRRELDDLCGRPVEHPLADRGPELIAPGDPVLEEDQLVDHPFRLLDHHAEVEPLLTGHGHEPDPAVLRLLDPGKVDRANGPHRMSGDRAIGHLVHRLAEDRRLEHRDVEQLTDSGRDGAGAGCEEPVRGKHPGGPPHEVATDADRGPIG
jgi:hypothetical protein